MNPTYQHYATHDESEFPHLWRGVVGAWAPCLGPSGTRLHDHSGRANWGTLTNMDPATDWVVDAGQYTLDFDGVNDFVSLLIPQVTYQAITFAAWVRPLALAVNRQRIFDTLNAAGTADSFALKVGTNSPFSDLHAFITTNLGAINVVTATGLVPLNAWTHCAATWSSGGNLRVYVNGVLRATSASTLGGTIPQAPVLDIGKLSFFNVFGLQQQDDSFVATRQFSASEIRELYQIGRGGMYTPRRRRRAYSFGPSFLAAWARGSNVILQPCGVS